MSDPAPPAFRPLYRQVRDSLVQRLIDGAWTPGMLLPSEHQLAAELGVSQGTVRKALDAMTAENLLVRRQGRGTFVATVAEERLLFQFFRIAADDGRPLVPESEVLARTGARATLLERQALALPAAARVFRVERVRRLAGRPAIAERLALPQARFPGFGDLAVLPNNVYQLYSEHYGVTICRAAERLKAVPADRDVARRLGCEERHPVLRIERIAYALDGAPVELRVSFCLSDELHYRADLG
jgi:GntR family transcriptional regulator